MSTPITDRALLVQRNLTGWSGRRFDRDASARLTAESGAEPDAARVNKLLVHKSLLRPIEQHDGEWQRWHESMTLPYPVRGLAILCAAAYFDYAEGTTERKRRRQELVDDLALRLPRALADAPRRLGGLLKAGDVPTAEAVIARYTAEVVMLPFPEASAIGSLVDDAATSETARYLDETVADAMRDVWRRVYAAVDHLADRLEQRAEDAGTRLYASVVGNVRELARVLPKLNLTGDGKLDAMRLELEGRLAVYDVETLRDDESLCRTAATEARGLLARMEEYAS